MPNDTLKWLIGGLVTATISWSSWITVAVWEDRARLARIETKIDMLVERILPLIPK